jgi:hypothetical protein
MRPDSAYHCASLWGITLPSMRAWSGCADRWTGGDAARKGTGPAGPLSGGQCATIHM